MILRHFGGKLGLKWGFGEFYKSGFAERKFCLVPPLKKLTILLNITMLIYSVPAFLFFLFQA